MRELPDAAFSEILIKPQSRPNAGNQASFRSPLLKDVKACEMARIASAVQSRCVDTCAGAVYYAQHQLDFYAANGFFQS